MGAMLRYGGHPDQVVEMLAPADVPRGADCIDGRLTSFQPNAIAATGTTQKNAQRHPTIPPRKA